MAVKKSNPTKKGKGGGLSLLPEDAEATGLLNDVDCLVTAAECTTFDYNGTQDDVPALKLTLEDEDGKENEQFWTAGSLDRIEPSEDGKTFVPAEGKKVKGVGKSTNFIKLMESLEAAGFPMSKLDNDVENLVGLKAHFVRSTVKGQKKDDGGDREVLLIEEIKKLPWDKKESKVAKINKTKKSSKKDVDEDEEEEEEEDDEAEEADEEEEDSDSEEFDAKEALTEVVGEILSDNESGLVAAKMTDMVFKKISKRPKEERKEMLELLQDDDFLGDEDQEVYTFDKKKKKFLPA